MAGCNEERVENFTTSTTRSEPRCDHTPDGPSRISLYLPVLFHNTTLSRGRRELRVIFSVHFPSRKPDQSRTSHVLYHSPPCPRRQPWISPHLTMCSLRETQRCHCFWLARPQLLAPRVTSSGAPRP